MQCSEVGKKRGGAGETRWFVCSEYSLREPSNRIEIASAAISIRPFDERASREAATREHGQRYPYAVDFRLIRKLQVAKCTLFARIKTR